MNFYLLSCLCIIVNLNFVSVTQSNQITADKDLTSVIQRYLDAKKLYQLVQGNTENTNNGEIAAADKEIDRLLKEIDGTNTLDTRTNLNQFASAARNWDFDDPYGGGSRATETPPAAASIPNTPPETSTAATTTTTTPTTTTTASTTTTTTTAQAAPSLSGSISSWWRRRGRIFGKRR